MQELKEVPKPMQAQRDFFDLYFEYTGETESPQIYHRWCALSMVGALLGRRVYLPFGHAPIYPNMYIMLEGNPGARSAEARSGSRFYLHWHQGRDAAAAY